MKTRIAVLAFITLFTSGMLTKMSAQSSYKEITTKFFGIYSQDPIKAVDYAFSTNKWFERKQDAVDNLKNQLKTLIDLCGEYYGYEQVNEKSAGTSLTVVTFIVKYDREPVRFTFTFYKAKDVWRINNFSFDENLIDEMEDASKINKTK